MKKIFLLIYVLLAGNYAMAQCGTTINPPGAGNYLGLNGSNQSVTIPDSDDWFFSNGDFAIECWVNPANASTRTLLTQSVANAATAGTSSFYMSVNSNGSGTFDFYSTTGTTWTNTMYTPAGSVPAGVWSHVAITRISGVVTMYVNGIAATTTGSVAATLPNGNQPLGIGVQNGALYFNGGLEEMRIYRGAGLTQTNVRDWMTKKMTASHPLWANCVGYYRFDEATGADVFDRKKCNNGTFNGSRLFNGSNAPLGDASAWNYGGNTSSAYVLFGTGGQDSLKATVTSGTAAGIHVYGISDTPNNRNNLPWLQDNNRYGGVWVVNGTNPIYSLAYGYANSPALLNTTAANFRLYKRISSNTLGWVEAPNSTNNTGSKYFTATGENTEYIMGGPNVVTPAPAAPAFTRVEYFFDADPGFGNGMDAGPVSGTTVTINNLPVSISGLSAGIHTLFVRSKNADGTWSHTIPGKFYYEPAFSNPLQNIVKAEYFFDTDPGFGNAIDAGAVNATTVNLNLTPTISSLNPGLHTFFVRTKDGNGKWSHSIPQTFYYEPAFSNPLQNIVKAEYFIDTDPGFGNGIDAGAVNATTVNLNLSPTINSLSPGLHKFFLRTKDANGKWSHSIPQTFYYEPAFSNPVQNIVKAEYFFDTDPGFGNAIDAGAVNAATINLNLTPGISSLSAGLHTFFIRSKDANGKWSHSIPQKFYYEPAFSNPVQNIVKAEYFFDTDPGFGNATDAGAVHAATINLNLEPVISTLTAGMHTFFMRTRDAAGKWSLSIPQTFYYEPAFSNPLQNIVKAEYFFDTDPGFGNAINHVVVPGTSVSFSINPTISSLSAGLHRFFIRTKDAAGKWSQSIPSLFYYEPIINNPYPDITRAEYYIDNFVPVGSGIPVVFAPNDTIKAIKFPVNITGVASGNHRLYLRTRDVNGKWSLTSWANFTLSGSSSAPAIVINSFTPNTICAGNSIDVAFHATGNYVNGNMFTLQLSDNNGLFGTPVNLGSVSSTVSTIINAVVPGSTSPNTYKLRVVSSNAAVTGATSDSSLVVLGASQSFMDSTIYLNCFNDTYNLTNLYNVSNGGVWNTPNPTVATPGMYKYYVTAGGGCSDTADITLKLEVATWTGALNSDWHVAGNWNINKVPGLFTHVIVPTATPNPCIISGSDATAASVQARGNGSFQIINGRKLVINGVCTVLPPN
ncbi:MAG: LamG domain-containing protein [Bacteroidota bacterium]